MVDLLIITVFICFAAYMQYRQTNRIMRYNNNLTGGIAPQAQKKTWFYCAMFVMMTLAALRSTSIGNDTAEYKNIFNQVLNVPDYISTSRYEIGYLYLNKFIGLFTSEFQVLLVVLAVFQYSVFTWFLSKYSDDLAFSLILCFLLLYGGTLNILRQMTATAFIFIAVDRVLNKHTIRAFILIAIAVLFHTSAVVFLVIPIIPHIKYNGKAAFVIFCVILLLTVTNAMYYLVNKLFPSYAHYFEGQYAESGWLALAYQTVRNGLLFALGYFGVKEITLSGDAVLFDKAKLAPEKQNNMTLWNLFFVFAFIIFAFRLNLIDRIVMYGTCFYVLLIPNTLKKFDIKLQTKIKIIIVVLLIAYSILVQYMRPEWNVIYPYKFFWE